MREILFRGKTFEGKRWIYGDLRQWWYGHVGICDRETNWEIKVEIESVGQYTGLTDKNGTKIFEGDVVKRCFNLTRGPRKETRETQVGVVCYDNVTCGYLIRGACNLRRQWPGDTIEVIGNIHDNPELMEVDHE